MNHGYESSDNFSNMFEYMNSCQHSSSESINELDTTEESNTIHEPEPESRSNSITSDDMDYCTITREIPIPIKKSMRKRETMFNGMSAFDLQGLTPTPTKYRNMIEENTQHVGSLIKKYYEEVEFNLSPYVNE
jgi:hypothetical protein